MKNIKVNYTNFNDQRTSTTIRFAIANVYYRESDLEGFKKTIYDREAHKEAVKNVAQKFVNEQHKEEDEDISTWEDKEMIEIAMIEDIIYRAKMGTIQKMKAL